MASPKPRRPPANSTFSDSAVRQRKAAQRRPPAASEPAQPIARSSVERRARRGPRTRPGGGGSPQILHGNYQPVILWEFLGVLFFTIATPVAKNKAKAGLSPYAGADMVKIAAIVLLFFLLAAVSSAGTGAARLAAWLGGLVLIADGLYEASNLAGDLALFTGGLARAANPSPSTPSSGPASSGEGTSGPTPPPPPTPEESGSE